MVYSLEQMLSDWKKNGLNPEQLNVINQERIKKHGVWVPWWDQHYAKYKEQKPSVVSKDNVASPWVPSLLWGIAWWLWATYWAWATTEWLGKRIYWAWLKAVWKTDAFVKEADAIATQEAFWWKPVKTIVDTAIEQPWVYWTPIGISTDIKKNMNNTWTKKVLPVVDEIDNGWFKMSIGKLEKKVLEGISKIKKISNVQWYADDIKKSVSDYFREKLDKWISSWNLKQIQAEKTALRNWIQKRVWAGLIPNDSDKLVEKLISDTYSDIVHSELLKKWAAGKVASDAFVDYGNMMALEWASAASAKTPLKGWWMWIVSALQETIWVPVSTAVGKLMAKAGNIIKEATLIPTLKRLWNRALKNIKSWIAKWLAPAELIAPDMLVQSYISQGMSEEESTQKAQQLRIQLFELPGKKLNELLDKALWTDNLQPKK